MRTSTVVTLVEQMRQAKLSRNRNFDVFAQPEGMRAQRLWRLLRSLERDLRRAPHAGQIAVEVETTPGGARRIRIDVPGVRLQRVTTLSAEEYGLLASQPDLQGVLEPPR